MRKSEIKRTEWNRQIRERFIFVYNPAKAFYLTEVEQLRYITRGNRQDTGDCFFLFDKTPDVLEAIKNFEVLKAKSGGFVTFEQLESMIEQ